MADNKGDGSGSGNTGNVVQSIQSDLKLPRSGLSMLTAIAPLCRALSADDVAPMALIQVSELGSLFHLNGKFADQVADALCRHKSLQLIDRLKHYVGWIEGDAASFMGDSAGGRAAALLCSILMEYYGTFGVGDILYELSVDLLPKNRGGCSKTQLSRFAAVLSSKLGILGFGSHLGQEVTRIREIYLNSNLPIPSTLIDRPTTNSMVEFLKALNRALTDETALLYVEGCSGIGLIVALLTALCPEDISISVENEITFRGHRNSVIVSIQVNQPIRFWVETRLTGDGVNVLPHLVAIDSSRDVGSIMHLCCNLKWDGFLAAHLDLLFLEEGYQVPDELRSACAELIASIALSISPEDLIDPRLDPRYPRGDLEGGLSDMNSNPRLEAGFSNLLGLYPRNRISDQLKRILTEPSFTHADFWDSFVQLHRVIQALVPEEVCSCKPHCSQALPWPATSYLLRPSCPIRRIWNHIAIIIEQGLAALFVTPGENATVNLKLRGVSLPVELTVAIMRAVNKAPRVQENIKPADLSYTAHTLHNRLQELLAGDRPVHADGIGVSSGSSSIFPALLLHPTFSDPPYLGYILEDGQFHDGQNYYRSLYCQPRKRTDEKIASEIQLPSIVTPSDLGCHSRFLITACPQHFGLEIITRVDCHGKQVEMSFQQLLLGYMGVKVADECSHNPKSPLESHHTSNVVTESVDYVVPVPRPQMSRIVLMLTYGSPKARFLACGNGGRTLFMGNSCLNCAVKQAKEEGFDVIIL